MTKAKPKGRYHHGDLRAALLEAAVEEIQERGPRDLSLRACARRVGVSHAAPYRHFADRDALLSAVAGQGFTWLTEAGRAAMKGLEDPRARVEAYGIAYVTFAVKHPHHHRLMFATPIDPSTVTPEDQQAGDAAFELLRANVAEVAGVADAMTAALAFWSMSHGLSMLILDGRVPAEHTGSPEAMTALARAVFAQWCPGGEHRPGGRPRG
jgi:AcrR family transcriptional regulator